MLGIIKK